MNMWNHLFLDGEYIQRERLLAGLTLDQVTRRPPGASHSIYDELWHATTWQNIVVDRDETGGEAWFGGGPGFPSERRQADDGSGKGDGRRRGRHVQRPGGSCRRLGEVCVEVRGRGGWPHLSWLLPAPTWALPRRRVSLGRPSRCLASKGPLPTWGGNSPVSGTVGGNPDRQPYVLQNSLNLAREACDVLVDISWRTSSGTDLTQPY
jgi:hypothetical protein